MESPHSVNSPRRTLSLSKQRRATVSFFDPDDKTSGFGLSGDHGPKPSEVYGFVGSITTVVATVIFLVWAYVPESWLQSVGISYYPSRYWALAVPTYVMVTIVLMLGFYIGLNFISTPSPASLNTVFVVGDSELGDRERERERQIKMEAVKMVGLKRLIRRRSSLRDYVVGSIAEKVHCTVPSPHLSRLTPKRFLDLHQFVNKEAIKKERDRLGDEMSRGYFADMAEFKQHGGKIAVANKVIIPAMVATKFPDFEVSFSDGKTMKLPIRVSDRAVNSDKSSIPKASLVCLSFRASSQELINSWSVPFIEAFRKSKDIHLYQVSFIDSWLLCRAPIKRFLLWTMKKPSHHESKDTLQKQMVYSFGDHYYFRKELKILNLLTGYIFLLDNFGRVRWQGFGLATEDELSSLLSCTSLLLDEE